MSAEPSPVRLERVAENAIIADVLRLGLPLMTGLSGFALAAGLLAGRDHPLRTVPAIVALVLCITSWLLARVDKQQVAIWLLAVAVAFATSFGMVFNGGLRAPAAALVLALVSMVGWLSGWRGATITAALTTVSVIAIGFASNAGLLRNPPLSPPLLHALFMCVYIWLVWITTAYPQRRLRMALQDAAVREEARREAEHRRVESELAFKSVFDNSAQVVMVGSSSGELLHLNRAARDFLGVEEDASVTHQSIAALPGWCDDSRERLTEGLQRVLPGRSSTFEVRRGALHFEFTLTRLLTGPSLGTGGVLLEGRDVRGLLEGEQREARARRLSLVGQLAGGVAHDFNNVLAVVMTSTEMLRADLEAKGPLSSEINESLEAIATSTQRASDLTRRLLTFSRQQPLAPKLISMHDFIESAVKLLQRVLPPRITVSAQLTAPRDTVKADVSSLESALLNLAINARDAMPGPGRLTISTSLVEPDELWQASGGSARWPDSFLRVSVRDTGAGIPRELQERLFEPFVTTKDEGTGIGLASVFATMHDHGGTVTVRSDEGRGTEFYLDFPLAEGTVSRPSRAGQERPWFADRRALIVDDEPALRRMVERLLQSMGFATVLAPDAETGLTLFNQSPHSFDLALLDVVLPGHQNNDLAKNLLDRSKELKIILASGFPRDADLAGLPEDRVRFLSKPFSTKALFGALRELLPHVVTKATG